MSYQGHYENSGLQKHSIGDIYPYSVVVIDRAVGKGFGVCEGRNLITGEVVCAISYNNNGPAGSFESAHRVAEHACRKAKELDDLAKATDDLAKVLNDFADHASAESAKPAQTEELTVCRLIVPIVRNSDGCRHTAEKWELLRHYFCDVFGGYTCREVHGGWRDENGRIIQDASIEFEAAGDAAAVKNLTDHASDIAGMFDQVCVYVAIGATAKLYYRPIA